MLSSMLKDGAPSDLFSQGFHLERRDFSKCLGDAPVDDQGSFYASCGKVFGPNTHVAGSVNVGGGCLIVMRSEREDDTSKPLLQAMRKAATQFSCARPSFAVQFQEIAPANLMLPHLRRRVGILSYALFGHYEGHHINATYFCGFGAMVGHDGVVGTPGFAVLNPEPSFSISPTDAEPFLLHMSDQDSAAAIGKPLPAPKISSLPI